MTSVSWQMSSVTSGLFAAGATFNRLTESVRNNLKAHFNNSCFKTCFGAQKRITWSNTKSQSHLYCQMLGDLYAGLVHGCSVGERNAVRKGDQAIFYVCWFTFYIYILVSCLQSWIALSVQQCQHLYSDRFWMWVNKRNCQFAELRFKSMSIFPHWLNPFKHCLIHSL